MSRVFIVQEPVWKNPATGRIEPKFDLSPAAVYGDVEFVVPGMRPPLSIEMMIENMIERLDGFSDDDYLLPAGNPVAIMWAGIIAAANNHGRVAVLQWDREQRIYLKMRGALP